MEHALAARGWGLHATARGGGSSNAASSSAASSSAASPAASFSASSQEIRTEGQRSARCGRGSAGRRLATRTGTPPVARPAAAIGDARTTPGRVGLSSARWRPHTATRARRAGRAGSPRNEPRAAQNGSRTRGRPAWTWAWCRSVAYLSRCTNSCPGRNFQAYAATRSRPAKPAKPAPVPLTSTPRSDRVARALEDSTRRRAHGLSSRRLEGPDGIPYRPAIHA